MHNIFINHKLYNKRNIEEEIQMMEEYYNHATDKDYLESLSESEMEDFLWIDTAFKTFVWNVSREMMKGVQHCYSSGVRTKEVMREHAEDCSVVAELNRPYSVNVFQAYLTGTEEFERVLRYEFVKNTLELMINGVRR